MTTTAERPVTNTTIFRRPKAKTGLWGWITTVDHKKIGIMYGYAAFTFFIIGGIEALLLRIQLAQANSEFLTAGAYNALFTMHGTTMIFLFVMPVGAAFMNYMLPLLIGARDVAFPRLNALSLWIFLFGGIFLYSTFILGTSAPPVGSGGISGNLAAGGGPGSFNLLADSPAAGWFAYQPNAGPLYSPGTAMDYWALGIQLLGLASLISSVNFIVTVFNMRAKGMRLLRMPVFAWMSTVVAFLLLFALPIIAVALFMVTFDRQFGSQFFVTTSGG
ncbi:MAG TPA: cbb3-type cytochrome c oxidase subunit I, partial [Acidimicrobiia bacterium]|nr:cbb3-type cytochrome c oxidase subunit I [Acidimicrobiia bacterium]